MSQSLSFGAALSCTILTCALATVLVTKRIKKHSKWYKMFQKIQEFEEGCSTSIIRLKQVVDAMAVEMHAGLASDGGSKLKMLISYVDTLPAGNEEGICYVLDLGGSNFRILRIKLGGSISKEIEQHQIPQNLMTGTSKDLFDYIAMTLKNFVDKVEDYSSRQGRQLGFTFSFPVRQLSISSGVLIKWTRGFEIKDAVGRDVAQCLEEAMIQRGLNMRVATLVNDTVGTLALGHNHDADTVAAVIIGTGTNACYIERSDAIIKCQGFDANSDKMVVNMEWGNFWSSHLPRTSYDIALDAESPNRNEQGFEKMISGMYLGEIARRVLLRIAEESDIFGDAVASLSAPFALRTNMMAAMHEDDSLELNEVNRILQENLKMPKISLNARKVVVRVCDIVTRRAARLTAAGIIGILKKIGRDGSGGVGSGRTRGKIQRTVVAIEGELYTGYSMFREYLNEAVVEILGEEVASNIVLRVSEDGSGIGAALLASTYSLDK